jgi:hypothetical protein
VYGVDEGHIVGLTVSHGLVIGFRHCNVCLFLGVDCSGTSLATAHGDFGADEL